MLFDASQCPEAAGHIIHKPTQRIGEAADRSTRNMTDRTQRRWWPSRSVQRVVHLGLATALGVFLYSPLRSVQGSDLVLQVIVFPFLTLSGLFMWKGHVIRTWLRNSQLTGETLPRRLFFFVFFVFLFGLGHHIDHVVRGNHVGWPLIPSVNAFTFSLLAYPFVGLGLYLGWQNRAGIRYWTVLFFVLATMVITQHFGPTANEPPGDVIGPYESQLLGSVAFGWLLVFTVVIVAALLYSGVLWFRRRESHNERTRAETEGHR